jgi:hypothetical protein
MSEAAAQPMYVAERGDVERDRDTVLAIWRGNLGQEAPMRAKFDWFYRGCPFGEPLILLLRHAPSQASAGAAAIGPRRMLWRSREIRVGVLVDLAVTPEHRSLGPALMLERELAKAGSERFDLVYGFPNAKAVAVFKRIGCYGKLADMVRYAHVLRHRDYVARRLPVALATPASWLLDRARRLGRAFRALRDEAVVASWSAGTDAARVDALWKRSTPGDGLIAVRDSTFLHWRFDDAPSSTTRFLLLSDPGDEALRAWFACQVKDAVLHVRDFWSEDGDRGISRAHADALLRSAYAEGHAAVSFEFAGADARTVGWTAAGFSERGRRPVYGRWSNEEVTTGLDLHLTSADEDE